MLRQFTKSFLRVNINYINYSNLNKFNDIFVISNVKFNNNNNNNNKVNDITAIDNIKFNNFNNRVRVSNFSKAITSQILVTNINKSNNNNNNLMADNKYSADYGNRVARCKKCKGKIEKGELRIAKLAANPFSDSGEMKLYHHAKCIFETFKRARATTKIIEDPSDVEGFARIKDEDKDLVRRLIKEFGRDSNAKKTPNKAKNNNNAKAKVKAESPNPSPTASKASTLATNGEVNRVLLIRLIRLPDSEIPDFRK